MPPKKPRDWNAVDAHFRRAGPIKHKNTPRAGAGADQEIEDELLRYQTEEARRAAEKLFEASPEDLSKTAKKEADVERTKPKSSS